MGDIGVTVSPGPREDVRGNRMEAARHMPGGFFCAMRRAAVPWKRPMSGSPLTRPVFINIV